MGLRPPLCKSRTDLPPLCRGHAGVAHHLHHALPVIWQRPGCHSKVMPCPCWWADLLPPVWPSSLALTATMTVPLVGPLHDARLSCFEPYASLRRLLLKACQ